MFAAALLSLTLSAVSVVAGPAYAKDPPPLTAAARQAGGDGPFGVPAERVADHWMPAENRLWDSGVSGLAAEEPGTNSLGQAVAAPSPAQSLEGKLPARLAMLLPLVVPLLLGLLKSAIPNIPDHYLPLLAPLLGALGDYLLQLAGGGGVGPLYGALLGSAGVGVREAVDQMKKRGTSAGAGTVLLLLGLGLVAADGGGCVRAPDQAAASGSGAAIAGAPSANVLDTNAVITAIQDAVPPAVRFACKKDTNAVAYLQQAAVVIRAAAMRGDFDPALIEQSLSTISIRELRTDEAQLAEETALALYKSFAAKVVGQKLDQVVWLQPVLDALSQAILEGLRK